MLTTKTMHSILQELAKDRPVFHSEADFRVHLARKIRKYCDKNKDKKTELEVDSEYPLPGKKTQIDILVTLGELRFPIELKYKTRKFQETVNGEEFHLKEHSAANDNCYSFWQDVKRVENFPFAKGFVIFLTNESGYWKKDGKGCDYEDFNIRDGKTKSGTMEWGNSKKKPMSLSGKYKIHWESYSRNGEFRYLLLEVEK